MSFDAEQRAYWTTQTNRRSADHPVVRRFGERRVRFINRLLADRRPERLLEVGCGDGFGMQHMAGLAGRLYGCDLSPAMLRANPAPHERLIRADAYRLPFAAGSFDLVYCWELLHHLADPGRAVAEMCRLSSGAVLICEPNALKPAMALFGLLKQEERGLLRFTPGHTARLLAAAGLREVRSYAVDSFTPNRTPGWLAGLLGRLPYHLPVVGMYSIALGWRG